jgi:hypothetical protein
MRIHNIDSRWRTDKYYIFYAYDTMIKSRILTANNMVKACSSIQKTAAELTKNNFDEYYKYGEYIPQSITGSKRFWNAKYFDLVSIINSVGLPHLFLTFTSNDSWPELNEILSKYENKCPLFNPVDVGEYFIQRFQYTMKYIKSKKLFGNIEHECYRIECQNRGSLHIHLLLWIFDFKIEKG